MSLPDGRTKCGACGGEVVEGSQCPLALECPTCHAAPRSPCIRPSGHRASQLHADRWRLAEQLDADRGITYPSPVS